MPIGTSSTPSTAAGSGDTQTSGGAAATSANRPAHRPSRRPMIIDGAIGLFATMPIDEVTVQDIAATVDMTPAAVYYHFASKEQILLEAMEIFRRELVAELATLLPIAKDDGGLSHLVTGVLEWAKARSELSTIYYVNSLGLNLAVEAQRRETRLELIELLRGAVAVMRTDSPDADACVIAVGLLSLIETSIASMLNQDATYRGIGARRFASEVALMADRIAGITPG